MDTLLNVRSPTRGTTMDVREDLESVRRAKGRFKALYNRRSPFVEKWKEIRDYEQPHYGDFDDEDNSQPTDHTQYIFNGLAEECSRTFAAGMLSGLTPPSRQWFKLGLVGSGDTPLRRVVDVRQQIMENVYARSNFYNAVHQGYGDLPFGQSPLGIFSAHGTVEFVQYPIGSYAMEVNAMGIVNVFARKSQMNAAQIAEQFGEDHCPQIVKTALRNGSTYDKNFTVCWMVEPNPKQIRDQLGTKKMPFRSMYWVEGTADSEVLAVTGFEECPIACARYQVKGNCPYGFGAGWYALPDSKMLQKMQFDLLMAEELTVKPPMQASAATAQRVNLVPAGVTVIEQQDYVKPLFQVQMDMNSISQEMQNVQQRIKSAYASDLFSMLSSMESKDMTASEVIARQQETLSLLGPITERLHHEFLNVIMDRVYNILQRTGVFPPIPPDMMSNGEELKVEYISPLAQAQKMSALTGITQAVSFLGQMAQFNPGLIDKMDLEKTIEDYNDRLGIPASLTRSSDEYNQIQQDKAKAQAEQAQQQAAVQQAAPLAQAAKNLTEAANAGNPALQEWMGMQK